MRAKKKLTEAQYSKLYRKALDSFKRLIRTGSKELRQIYIEASEQVTKSILDAELSGLSDLTTGSWANIKLSLENAARSIRDKVEPYISNIMKNSTRTVSAIDEEYIISAIKDAGGDVSITSIRNLFVRVDEQVIASLFSRIYQDGYSFSERVWRVGIQYQEDVKRVIQLGLSQGRDMIDIARDLEVYVQKGKKGIVKRIGDLLEGTSEFRKRIRKDIDYNALRILRSELYASLQDSARYSGMINPGCTNFYRWIRTYSEDFGCDCPDYEQNSPYSLNDLPSYPHPNCSCRIEPILMNRADFVNDLSAWANGESIQYLDDWEMQYLQFA